MGMPRLYHELDAEHRKVYHTSLRMTFLLWGAMLLAALVACTVLALDASTTPEQRSQQSGVFP